MSRVQSEPGWIFSKREDLLVFGGSALLSFALFFVGLPLGLWTRPYPLWAWLLTVLFVDVAHVWSTIFRVYLDGREVRRRPWLYVAMPVALYAIGVAIYSAFGHAGFWRALAYSAVWHFVRQQVGWVAIYHRLRGETDTRDARLDRAVAYGATLGPIVIWHGRLPREFDWFVAGDFVRGAVSESVARGTDRALLALVAVWCARQLQRAWLARRKRARAPNPGVALVLVTTFACWYGGIVLSNNDWCFTVTNVLIHGLPYLALLWRYARNRFDEDEAGELGAGGAPREAGLGRAVVLSGAWAFVALLAAIALVEEFAWDQLAWHERTALFGDLGLRWSTEILRWVVPLLALPQAAHYVLDAFVWRGGSANPGMPRILGLLPSAENPL
ncbi:MAG: hypothetical protein U0269_12760 [Polyangiales bacterium]